MTVGTDITEIARIEKMLATHPRFLTTIFTEKEIRYCQAKKNTSQHFAARFAVKESVMKAVGKGWLQGLEWTDIETVSLPSGEPTIEAHGTLISAMQAKGITSFAVSISHCKDYAIATVIGLT